MDAVTPDTAKLEQFTAELNALTDKYQYQMRPILIYNKDNISTEIQVFDVPPKTEVPVTDATPEPAVSVAPVAPTEPIEPTAPDQPAPETPSEPQPTG